MHDSLPPIDARPANADRLPPGQVVTTKWPVLHYSFVPAIDRAQWRLEVTGLVANPVSLTWDALMDIGLQDTQCDMHCVTHWSRYDNTFRGVSVQALLRYVQPLDTAHYVMVHALPEYSTNVPLADLDLPANLLATHHDGVPLTPEHGGPIRMLIPHLYLWKSAKWVTGLEFLGEDWPGLWEENGYHMRGDPWAEERFGKPHPKRMRRGGRGSSPLGGP